jgi:hypothetical protein
MKLINTKFLEFRFTVPKIKIDTNIISITYFKSWLDVFTICKSRIDLNLKHIGGKSYELSFDKYKTILYSNDDILLQIYVFKNELFIIVNPPIHVDKLDVDDYQDTFGDIWCKADFKLLSWFNFSLGINNIATNFIAKSWKDCLK